MTSLTALGFASSYFPASSELFPSKMEAKLVPNVSEEDGERLLAKRGATILL